jgi:hypothetical protein
VLRFAYYAIMQQYVDRLGIYPYLVIGLGLFLLGLFAVNHLTTNIWLFDPQANPALARSLVRDETDAAMVLQAAYPEFIATFLAVVLGLVTGFFLPIMYFLNKRFHLSDGHFLVILRQAFWIGGWVAFCVWLQMNRALTGAIAILVIGVLFMFELLLQIRRRAQSETEIFQ